jgi:hypothetical protein
MKQKSQLFFFILIILATNTFAKKVAFIDTNSTVFAVRQDGISNALIAAGYEVTNIDITVKPVDFVALATYDLIVISKACNSGDFSAAGDIASWASLSKPYICLSPYIIRSNRLNLINSAGYTFSADKTDLTSITKGVPLVEDAVLEGVTTSLEPFDYFVGYYETITTTATTMNGNTGKVIVALNSDAVKGAGFPLMIRWEAGATFATGVTNTAPRTYLGIGSDNTTLDQNYNNFTPQSLKLFLNEVNRLAPLPASLTQIKALNQLAIVKGHSLQLTIETNSVQIYNAAGKMVISQDYSTNRTLNINKNGIYLVKANTNQETFTQKIMIK